MAHVVIIDLTSVSVCSTQTGEYDVNSKAKRDKLEALLETKGGISEQERLAIREPNHPGF